MNKTRTNVLVIDDDPAVLDCLRMSLNNSGNYRPVCCADALSGMEELNTQDFSVVIADVMMPRMSGLELLAWINANRPNIPVVLITGESQKEIMLQAIHHGVYDFLHKPFSLTTLHKTVNQAVQKHDLMVQNEQYKNHLESLVELRTHELNQARMMLEKSYLNTIRAMVNAIEVNDIYTRGHSERVTAISLLLGQALEVNADDMHVLRIGALLHDLGKIGITSTVLKKDQNLTPTEYDSMKQHPIIGAKIIDPIGLPKTVSEIILQHHEWYNGSGYPNGIDHSKIHPLTSIVAVADSFDAMTSKRNYRDKLDYVDAVKEVLRHKGVQFDPLVAEALFNCQMQVFQALKTPKMIRDLLTQDLSYGA